MRDLDVLEYFVSVMEDVSLKLEKAVSLGRFEESEKLKKIIFEISKNISEELV